MATIILKLDVRRANAKGQYPIQLQLSHNSKCTSIGTGISIRTEFWNGEINKAVMPQCPNAKALNSDLEALYFKYSNALRELELSGKLNRMTITDIRKALLEEKTQATVASFNAYFAVFVGRIIHPGTKGIYQLTQIRMGWFAEKTGISDDWRFEDITIDWLKKFEYFLRTKHLDECGNPIAGVRPMTTNTIAISMRNIRAVVNAAIDEELTTLYPFRKFKIKQEETAKRSLTIEELRTLRDYPCEPHQEKYRDLFMLIFYLVGINTIDLFSLTEIRNGRIEYRRSKTGRLFSIKVEPEAQALLDKYKGTGYLLDVMDGYANYKDFAHRMNNNLKQIGEMERKGQGGKKHREVLFPKLSTYWARHTWATIAAELDISDETISLALGHSSGNRVTNIYINRNLKKVDEANRKVIDHLFGITLEESEKK